MSSRGRRRRGDELPLRPDGPHPVGRRASPGPPRRAAGQPAAGGAGRRPHLHHRAAGGAGRAAGRRAVRLFLTSDNPYADVFLRLCDVDPRGRSVNVTDRLVRLDPANGEAPPAGERIVGATLPDTAHRFLAGHRIRLQVSGGAHPRYARNLGTGEPLGRATRAVPLTHRIGHSAASPSSITLPIASVPAETDVGTR